MSAPLGTPAAEVRKLQNLVDDGRRLRAQLRRVARALDKADPRERTAARAGLDTIARRGRGYATLNGERLRCARPDLVSGGKGLRDAVLCVGNPPEVSA